MTTDRTSSDGLMPCAPERIRAWRRPVAIAAVYLYRVVGALALALPFGVLANSAAGEHPRGDAVLFEAGGVFLLDSLVRMGPAIVPLSTAAAVLGAVIAFGGLLPLAALLVALAHDGSLRARSVLARAIVHFDTFALLSGIALTLALFVGLTVLLVGELFVGRLPWSAPAKDVARLGLLGCAVCSMGAVGVLHDFCRAAVVRGSLGLTAGVREGLRRAFCHAGRAAAGSLLRAGLAAVALASGAFAAEVLSSPSEARGLGAAYAAHGIALLGVVCLRASWLAAVLRWVSESSGAPGSEGGSFEPDPNL